MDVINDMFIDIHLHSTFSPDGTSTMEEYCLKAINKGIQFSKSIRVQNGELRQPFFVFKPNI